MHAVFDDSAAPTLDGAACSNFPWGGEGGLMDRMYELSKQRYYALIDRKAVAIDDLLQWARWYEAARKSGTTQIAHESAGSRWCVSTMFLALDHASVGGPPVLFETMVSERHYDSDTGGFRESMWRYPMLDEAEAGHKAVVEMLIKHEADAIGQAPALLAFVRHEVFGRRRIHDTHSLPTIR